MQQGSTHHSWLMPPSGRGGGFTRTLGCLCVHGRRNRHHIGEGNHDLHGA